MNYVRARRDGDVGLLRLAVQCIRCRAVSVTLPWHEGQEISCVVYGAFLAMVDAKIAESP